MTFPYSPEAYFLRLLNMAGTPISQDGNTGKIIKNPCNILHFCYSDFLTCSAILYRIKQYYTLWVRRCERIMETARKQSKKFCHVVIKPSHYDDEGYVIQWYRSAIPSNSLAVLYGLALECAEQKVLGADVELEIHAFDETNTRIRPAYIASLVESAGSGMVMLVGVQSNQFPRALDIAAPLRQRDIMVAIGGFHVSGALPLLAAR